MAQKKETGSGDRPSDPFTVFMREMQRAGPGPMPWLGTAWLEAMGEISAELSQFVAERIKEDVRTQHEILHCRDPERLRAIQARFMQKALDQYTAETGKLMEKSQDLMERLTKPQPD